MKPKNHTKNKLIILARKVWDNTKDSDLTFRKISKSLSISEGTANEVHKKYRNMYDFGIAFKVEKKKK